MGIIDIELSSCGETVEELAFNIRLTGTNLVIPGLKVPTIVGMACLYLSCKMIYRGHRWIAVEYVLLAGCFFAGLNISFSAFHTIKLAVSLMLFLLEIRCWPPIPNVARNVKALTFMYSCSFDPIIGAGKDAFRFIYNESHSRHMSTLLQLSTWKLRDKMSVARYVGIVIESPAEPIEAGKELDNHRVECASQAAYTLSSHPHLSHSTAHWYSPVHWIVFGMLGVSMLGAMYIPILVGIHKGHIARDDGMKMLGLIPYFLCLLLTFFHLMLEFVVEMPLRLDSTTKLHKHYEFRHFWLEGITCLLTMALVIVWHVIVPRVVTYHSFFLYFALCGLASSKVHQAVCKLKDKYAEKEDKAVQTIHTTAEGESKGMTVLVQAA